MDIHYTIKRQFWQLLGTTVRTYDATGRMVCLAYASDFKLREQVTFYGDEAKSQVLFRVEIRRILDISPTYDITNLTGELLGSLRRKNLKSSLLRDEWLILDANEQGIGSIREDSQRLALLRRFLILAAFFLPQRYEIHVGEQLLGTIQQNKNRLKLKLQCSYQAAAKERLGETLLLAIPNLLAVIEARQN